VFHGALIIRRIEANLAMRIRPLDLRDRGLLKSGHGGHVISGIAVVRHDSARRYEKKSREKAGYFHLSTPGSAVIQQWPIEYTSGSFLSSTADAKPGLSAFALLDRFPQIGK
jgi:hypothetical protein